MKSVQVMTAAVLASGLWACGRTEPLRYDVPASHSTTDGGRDAGNEQPDAGPKPCIDGRFKLVPATPVVLLVLDQSGSMAERFSGSTSKWQALATALRASLPGVDQSMELGLLLFPVSRAATCSVFSSPNIEAGFGRVASILNDVQRAQPAGGTPTADAILFASRALQARRTSSTARALLLATDGSPNCNAQLNPMTCRCSAARCRAVECIDDDRTAARLSTTFDGGIPTYVVGIESATQNFTSTLNRLAVAGGRALPGPQQYYSARNTAELESALASIRDQVGRCTLLTESVPNMTGTIRVELNQQSLEYGSAWLWADRANGELVLQGSACAELMRGPSLLEAVVKCGLP